MDLPQTIATNQTALARIVGGLFALLGLTGGPVPARIPGQLHRSILRVLLSAESAARRLIVIVSKTIRVKAPAARPMPGNIVRAGQGQQRLSFQLFDPRPRLFRPQRKPKAALRPQPRLSFFRDDEVRTVTWGEPPPVKDGQQNSANLLRRLQALKSALDDLPRQARRLARALARRRKSPRLKLKGVMRPGRAPGWRKRPLEDIDHVLHQCDWLARDLLPDTS